MTYRRCYRIVAPTLVVFGVFAFGFSEGVGTSQLLADDAAPGTTAKQPQIPADSPADPQDSFDLAFAQYINLDLLVAGWQTMDPALLTDAALQLAEGERVLMRSHKVGSAKQVLSMAAQTAGRKGDEAALNRITKAAKSLGYDELLAEVSAAAKLAGTSRKVIPNISIEGASPESLATFGFLVRDIKNAELQGDLETLKAIEHHADDLTGNMSKSQREYLKKILGDARTGAEENPNPLAETLRQLAGSTRGPFSFSIPGVVSVGTGGSGGTRVSVGGGATPGYGTTYGTTGYGTPGYAAPGYAAPGYAAPGYAAPGYAAPGYSAPGYARPGYTRAGYTRPGYTTGGGAVPTGGRWVQDAYGNVYWQP